MHMILDICIHILSRLFECTGIAIALTLASVLVSGGIGVSKILKFYIKVSV